MTIDQFTEHLNKTTSSIFSPTAPREPTLLRDPNPPKDESKGKGIATKEPPKEIMPFMKEGAYGMKRLSDLKAEKEKSEKSLQKIMNPSTVRARLRAKFEWVLTQAKKLGVPPPPELSTFRISVDDGKRKRSLEILQEVFVKENIVVGGMHRNLIHPSGVEASTPQLVRLHNGILRGTPEVEEIFKKLELTIEARNDTSAGTKGLAECRASASNLRRIQVKDIVKEVKDHLKTYSSDEMNICWYVEGIRCVSKEDKRWQYSDYPVTLWKRTSRA
nr:hypothetical protein [Tanacetum cinerariifolium]